MSQIITIAQQKGGAGKTTLATHLAVALQQKGQRVAILDVDPQGSLGFWHRAREKQFGEGYTGLTFSSVSGWRVASEVSKLKKSHDFIIIDSPPHTETEARTAIRSADLILIPIQPSPTDYWATQATLDIAKAEKKPVKVVLNRVTHQSKLAGMLSGKLPNLTKTTLGNRVLFAAALMEGRTATEVAPSSLAAEEIKSLVKEVLKTLQATQASTAQSKTQSRKLEPA